MKTIAKQLNIKKFPFEINDHNGNIEFKSKTDGATIKITFIK